MIKPIQRFLYNKRLNYTAFLYLLDGNLLEIYPAQGQAHKFGLSLLPTLSPVPHSASIFAWTTSDSPTALHPNSLEQPAFLALLHTTIRKSPSQLEYLMSSRARRQGSGWLSIVDERAPWMYGRTPEPEDTVGMVRCEDGKVQMETYSPMPTYRLVSPLGIFSLPKPLHDCVMSTLEAARN